MDTGSRAILVTALGVLLCASASPAPAEPVRVLEESPDSVILGTDAFSVQVDCTGRLGPLTVGETEQIWLIALYTTPISFRTGEGLRAVQGETSRGGLGPAPESIHGDLRGESATVVISRNCLREEILGGDPLYRLTQTVTVHPTGRVHLRYEFNWLRLVHLRGANLVIAMRARPLDGCRWSADFTSHALGGTISADPDEHSLSELRGELRTFTVDCGQAPLHLWVNDGAQVTVQRWNPDDYAFFMRVPKLGYPARAYPGVRSLIDLDIVLPVKRED